MEKQLQDKELLILIKSDDTNALTTLLEKYKSVVNALARPYFIAGGDFEDLVQEGMIGLYKAINTYDLQSSNSFITYAYTCIRSKIFDAIKTANRNKHKALNNYVPISLFGKNINMLTSSPEELAIEQENSSLLREKIYNLLSEKESAIFSLYLEGKSYNNIALDCDISVKAVDKYLQKIKRKIRKINFEKF